MAWRLSRHMICLLNIKQSSHGSCLRSVSGTRHDNWCNYRDCVPLLTHSSPTRKRSVGRSNYKIICLRGTEWNEHISISFQLFIHCLVNVIRKMLFDLFVKCSLVWLRRAVSMIGKHQYCRKNSFLAIFSYFASTQKQFIQLLISISHRWVRSCLRVFGKYLNFLLSHKRAFESFPLPSSSFHPLSAFLSLSRLSKLIVPSSEM